MSSQSHEKKISEIYNKRWHELKDSWNDVDTLALHHGYYKNDTKTSREAIYNMNNLVGSLLNLRDEKPMRILDAGCGVGGTSIYLAKRHPNIKFIGISIAHEEVKFAKKYAKTNQVKNAEFILANFVNTDFPDNYFDNIFAVESLSFAENHNDFVDEMYRILKPSGRFIVFDVFIKKPSMSSIIKKVYKEYCREYGFVRIPLINEYEFYLKEKGFKEIKFFDISKNISPYFYRDCVLNFFVYTCKLFRRLFKIKNNKKKNNLDSHYRWLTFLAIILGLSATVSYYTTIAIKK
ncbi:MAG: methyltransferase domain-containing protein [Thermoplasmatales archaeon]|nr:methyltransferase domain-containing protein [Thermoplasmatales archaeon]